MTSTALLVSVISILLSIVGFIGAMMVKQLIKIADAVQKIQIDLNIQATDHANLKEDHFELKARVHNLESFYQK